MLHHNSRNTQKHNLGIFSSKWCCTQRFPKVIKHQTWLPAAAKEQRCVHSAVLVSDSILGKSHFTLFQLATTTSAYLWGWSRQVPPCQICAVVITLFGSSFYPTRSKPEWALCIGQLCQEWDGLRARSDRHNFKDVPGADQVWGPKAQGSQICWLDIVWCCFFNLSRYVRERGICSWDGPRFSRCSWCSALPILDSSLR